MRKLTLLAATFAAMAQVRIPGPGGAPATATSSLAFVSGNSVAGCNGGSPACSLTLSGVPVGAQIVAFTAATTTSITGTLGEAFTLKRTITTGGSNSAWVSTTTTSSGTDTITNNGGYSAMEVVAYSSATGYDNSATNGTGTANTGPITLSVPGTGGDIAVVWVNGPLTSPVSSACGSPTLRVNDGAVVFDVAMASNSYSLSCTIGYSSSWGAIGVSLK
jgi:hypothetical protein